MRVVLAQPRGFCAGVTRAIAVVERALELFGAPVYVRHQIVHNRTVVRDLAGKGAVFVDEVADVPEGGIVVFSAHGVARKVAGEAAARGLEVIDATCPLVRRVHNEGRRYARERREIVLIGHAGHPEVEGTMGNLEAPVHLVSTLEDVDRLEVADPGRVAYVTQTTLSVDDTRAVIAALKERFPGIVGPSTNDICYATQNRQQAVRQLARLADLVLVIGSRNSSNSTRLREIAAEAGRPSYLIDDAEELDAAWLDGVETLGITAGASAPEALVTRLIERLRSLREIKVETLSGIEETVEMRLPPELTRRAPRRLATAAR
jgi:4-hydroxy-3-methylbut-2-enyl diphosphate reductase